jgi:ribosomal protein S20
MKKNTVKINENALKQIVAESVKKVLKEGYNQQTVDDAIQALFSIENIVDKAKTQVGFNPNEGDREVAKLITQIGTLIYRLKQIVYADTYQEKWDRETHEQD